MTITWDLHKKLQDITTHQMTIIKEREDEIHFTWVNRIAQQHILYVGGPGTAKTFLARNMHEHITGGYRFETTLDETSSPDVLLGGPNIKILAETGVVERVIDGMLPEATDAFIDEIFNANGPTLKSTQPLLNERLMPQGRTTIPIPLRSMIAATNQLNMDEDIRAMWDRIHQRHVVHPIRSRVEQVAMVTEAVERRSKLGRGMRTEIDGNLVTFSVEELDQIHQEALELPMSDKAFEAFFDLRDGLRNELDIEVSDRRLNDGVEATLANAWARGHEEVLIGDLDVLTHMWWKTLDDRQAVRSAILLAVNPSDKHAADANDDLNKLRDEFDKAVVHEDPRVTNNMGVAIMTNAERLYQEVQGHLEKAETEGWPLEKLTRVQARIDDFKLEVSNKLFGL